MSHHLAQQVSSPRHIQFAKHIIQQQYRLVPRTGAHISKFGQFRGKGRRALLTA